MKKGDLVHIVSKSYWPNTVGVIIGSFNDFQDGFQQFEVMIGSDIEWFSDIELRLIHDNSDSSAVTE